MSDELPDVLRDLVAAERAAPIASPAAQAAVRTKLGATLGIAKATAVTATTATVVKTTLTLKILAVVDEHTREEDFGWVFFYNTKQFLETGDVQWSLGGNAPLIVDRHEGKLHVTGTAYPVEHYIEEFRKSLR